MLHVFLNAESQTLFRTKHHASVTPDQMRSCLGREIGEIIQLIGVLSLMAASK